MLWIILLYAGGIALILAEFLLPGGILGVAGALCLLGSAGMVIYLYPGEAFWVVIVQLLGLFMSVPLGFYMLPRIGLGRRLILADEQLIEEGYVSNESDASLLNQIGEAYTYLRPSGTIVVDGKRMGAVTTGGFIQKGDSVRIVEVHGNRIVVEPADL
jgi:membrane-bound serine protease (ClpP class)